MIITADIHLTDKPSDLYRWDLFPWLIKQVDGDKTLAILGDLTDAKDRHSAKLVNRLTYAMQDLSRAFDMVLFVKGNHDYVDKDNPFFGYLRTLDNVHVIATEPAAFEINGRIVLAVPNSVDFAAEYEGYPWNDYNVVLTHQTYDGCITENGTRLGGVPPSIFKGFKGKVWSGDIHAPQKVGPVIEYVGAPYRVRFGDRFQPRVVQYAVATKRTLDLKYSCPSKHVVTIGNIADIYKPEHRAMKAGDQVKVRVLLKRADYAGWPVLQAEIKALAAERGWLLTGPLLEPLQRNGAETDKIQAARQGIAAPEGLVRQHAKYKRMSQEAEAIGLAILKEISQ